MKFKSYTSYGLGASVIVSIIVWCSTNAAGQMFGLALNSACYKYLGCTSGFAGYDAVEHFSFGIALLFSIIWLCRKYPKYSILTDTRWKNVLTLISILWEFGECAHDYFRLDILGEHLRDIKLHTNYLDQPTNLDTMGDIFFSMLGFIISMFSVKL